MQEINYVFTPTEINLELYGAMYIVYTNSMEIKLKTEINRIKKSPHKKEQMGKDCEVFQYIIHSPPNCICGRRCIIKHIQILYYNGFNIHRMLHAD
jgi:hypothetical protein